MLRGKRVLVLGIGNSATDIAVESSRIADTTFLAMRRGAYVMPKYLSGKPTDELGQRRADAAAAAGAALPAARAAEARGRRHDRLRAARARPQAARGAPDGLLGAAAAARPRRHHGQAEHRALRRRPHGPLRRRQRARRSTWSSTAPATRSPSPSSTRTVLAPPDNQMPLYRRVVSLEHPGLYFIGLIQPLGAIMPIAEAQSEWVADLLEGRGALPARGGDAGGDRARGPARWRSATSPRSGTRSRWTSTPTCARSRRERARLAQPALDHGRQGRGPRSGGCGVVGGRPARTGAGGVSTGCARRAGSGQRGGRPRVRPGAGRAGASAAGASA